MSDDLPLPDTPETQMRVPRGMEISTVWRLWPVAPFSSKNFPLPALREVGTAMDCRLLR